MARRASRAYGAIVPRSAAHAAFGSAVRAIRHERGLSQATLAERSDLDPTYISGVERGERNPSLISVFKIADALGVAASQIHARAETSGGARR
jgi:XRE family transcriptional regulator, regulator of sulfur utilization